MLTGHLLDHMRLGRCEIEKAGVIAAEAFEEVLDVAIAARFDQVGVQVVVELRRGVRLDHAHKHRLFELAFCEVQSRQLELFANLEEAVQVRFVEPADPPAAPGNVNHKSLARQSAKDLPKHRSADVKSARGLLLAEEFGFARQTSFDDFSFERLLDLQARPWQLESHAPARPHFRLALRTRTLRDDEPTAGILLEHPGFHQHPNRLAHGSQTDPVALRQGRERSVGFAKPARANPSEKVRVNRFANRRPHRTPQCCGLQAIMTIGPDGVHHPLDFVCKIIFTNFVRKSNPTFTDIAPSDRKKRLRRLYTKERLLQMSVNWRGVFPASTTEFKADQSLDLPATIAHVESMIAAGVHGMIMLGTVGENCSLSYQEKLDILKATVAHVGGRIPVLTGVAECTTALAAKFAADAAKIGVDGLMLLPAMVYKSDPRETIAHYRTVARLVDLPIMVYNNPVSYSVDITPEMFADLADESKFVAIKESSENVRRITDLKNVCGDRYLLFCGVDDLVLESAMFGAIGWVSGLVNAFPAENRLLWDLVEEGQWDEALAVYRWYTPLLHLDTHVKLVQYIKLAAQECGLGSEMVPRPRLPLVGAEREQVVALIRRSIASRPMIPAAAK